LYLSLDGCPISLFLPRRRLSLLFKVVETVFIVTSVLFISFSDELFFRKI